MAQGVHRYQEIAIGRAIPRTASSTRSRAAILASTFALTTAFAITLNFLVPPAAIVRDLRVKQEVPANIYRDDHFTSPPDLPFGLLDPVRAPNGSTVRWTNGHATLTFPYAGNIARHSNLTLSLAGMRGADQPPARAVISLNGREMAQVDLAESYQDVYLSLDTQRVPNAYLHPSDVQVDIESTTVVEPASGATRGIAVGDVRLEPERARSHIAIEGAIWGLCMLVLVVIATARLSTIWSLVYSFAALLSFVIAQLTYTPRSIAPVVEIALLGIGWSVAAWLAPRSRPWLGLALAAGALLLVLSGRLLVDWEMDDSYIAFRYASNLVQGNGLVYNPGEAVEGYTDFLWIIYVAGGMLFGVEPGGTALAGTIACSIGLMALTYLLGARLAGGNRMWPLLAVALLLVDASFITYGPRGSGLETVPFAFLVLLSTALLWHRGGERLLWWRAGGGLALALAALTRPEGLMVAVVLLALRAWQDRSAGRQTTHLAFAALAPFLALLLPYHAWRLAYYGYPFPNTFYAKTGTTLSLLWRGLEYAWSFAADHWLVVLLALAGIGMTIVQVVRARQQPRSSPDGVAQPGEDSSRSLRAALALLIVVFTLYIIAAGGDWANAGRFFVVVVAPIALLSQEAIRLGLSSLRVRPAAFRATAVAVAAVVIAYMGYALWLQSPGGHLATRTLREFYKAQKWGMAGLWIRDNTSPDAVLAASPAGTMAYYSGRHTIDMFGLADKHIAHMNVKDMGTRLAGHEKSDPSYVLDRKPDYLLRYEQWYFEPIAQRLDREYEVIYVRTPSGYWTHFYRRKT